MGLHQNTAIGSVDITDTWEPLEEGLNRLETTRHVSVITITLSTALLDVTTVGYQAPIENELVKPLQETAGPSRARNLGRSIPYTQMTAACDFRNSFNLQGKTQLDQLPPFSTIFWMDMWR